MGAGTYPSDPPTQQPQYQQAANNQWLENQAYEHHRRQEAMYQSQRQEQQRQHEAAQQSQRQYEDRQRQEQQRQDEQRRSSNGGGNGSSSGGGGSGGGGGGGDSDYLSRRFNHERNGDFPWNPNAPNTQYTPVGGGIYQTPWGRLVDDHTMDMMRKRDVSAETMEKTITYGQKKAYGDPEIGHNRVGHGITVGVTRDESQTITTFPDRRYR